MENVITVKFSFDDGSIFDVRVADLMYHYGIETKFYIPANWQTYLNQKGIEPLTSDLLKMISDQFEIGSHGVNHELLTRVDEDVQTYEIYKSREFWSEFVQGDVNSFCYPRGYFNEEIKKKVENAGYLDARTTKVGNLLKPKDPFESPTTIHVGYDRDEYNTDWFTYGKIMVKEALKLSSEGKKVEFTAWGHSEEINRLDQWERFEEFLKYLRDTIL